VEKSEGSGTLRLQLRGIKLNNTGVPGINVLTKSDPFYEILKKTTGVKGVAWGTVYRSKPVFQDLSPTWGDAVLNLSSLCSGDQERPIKISVYDYKKTGHHVFMGSFETSVNGLLASKSLGGDINSSDVQSAFQLRKQDKSTGQIVVLRADIKGVDDGLSGKMAAASLDGASETRADPALAQTASAPVIPASSAPPAATSTPAPFVPAATAPAAPFVPAATAPPAAFVPSPAQPTFVDYISGGCELHLCVAIDFTGSNGDPRKPGTLHHFSRGGSLNDYEKAITAIGEILAKYDSDQKFPVWGFGAKYGGVVRHCFQCGPTSEANGVNGIIEAYRAVFRTGLIMSGPTVFTEVIQLAAANARRAQEEASAKGQQAYTILLILTDGSVSDVNAAATSLNSASDAPLSVVIVGIGTADFSAMRFLDDFDSKRDIANFIEFNAHNHSKESLTAATLDEIPAQLVGYFTGKGIVPLPPVQRGDDDIEIEPFNPEQEIDLALDFEDDEIVVGGGGAFVPPSVY